MAANEIWRIGLDGGAPETVARGLGVPDATLAPGLDNLSFIGERRFVSSISGRIHEVLGDGSVRPLAPHGLNFPLGIAMGDDGVLHLADGGFAYTLRPGGPLDVSGRRAQRRGPKIPSWHTAQYGTNGSVR